MMLIRNIFLRKCFKKNGHTYHDSYRFRLIGFFFVILFFILNSHASQGIKLDKDGGYTITIGVDEFESDVDAIIVEKNLASIKKEISELSKWIHSTTGKFHIKHVDILLPATLSRRVKTDGIAKAESYKTADIKISSKNHDIHVHNPNGCGIPGKSIVLPWKLFNDTSNFENFASGKTLLHSFARYRWGVFEEHGMSSDTERYPKYYKGVIDKNGTMVHAWMTTYCTNRTLERILLQDQHRENDDEERPFDLFKFKPTDETPQSNFAGSIMSYPWMKNFNAFCDEQTHNKLAPTPQNVLCNYKSVMEIIRSTEDWKFATHNSQLDSYIPKFRTLRISDKPHFYLLLDKHVSLIPEDTLKNIRNQIEKLFNKLDPTIITQIGAFPSSHSEIAEIDVLLPWNCTSEIRSVGPKIVEKYFSSGTAKQGNFGSALFEVSKTIQSLSHPEGAIVTILKLGSGAIYSGRNQEYNFEHEIIASLKIANARLHALEFKRSATSSGINLENLVRQVGGSHTFLEGTSFENDKLESFTRNLKAEFEIISETEEDDMETFTQESRNTVVVYKGYTNGTHEGDTYHPGKNLNGLQVYLSSEFPLVTPVIIMNDMKYPFKVGFEWNREFGDDGFRYIHHSELTAALEHDNNGPLSVTFGCTLESCDAYLIILGEVDRKEHEENSEPYIEISTSSPINYFDWSDSKDSSNPFHVYASFSGHMPSSHRMELTGIVCSMDESPCQNYLMIDDGNGEPDIFKNDGVYSLSFIPNHDGRYYVKIICNIFSGNDLVLTRTFDYDSILTLKGTSRFQPSIRKINDLKVTDKRGDTVELEFTASIVYGLKGKELKAEAYELRYAAAYNDLLYDFDHCPIPKTKTDIPKPLKPGTVQSVKVDVDDEKDIYFAIRSHSGGMQSEASNLVSSGLMLPPENMEAQQIEKTYKLEEISSSHISLNSEERIFTSDDDDEYSTTQSAMHSNETDFPKSIMKQENGIIHEIIKETPQSSKVSNASNPLPQNPIRMDSLFSSTEDYTSTSTEETFPTETTTEDGDNTRSTIEESTSTESPLPTATSTSSPSSTRASTTTTTLPPSKPDDELFYKKPIGYITAGVAGGLILVALGGTIGYLYWKRRQLITSRQLIYRDEII